jgi:hypothetical protein
MPEELTVGIALCTAWERGDLESWSKIAHRNGVRDADGPMTALAELSSIAAQLARALGAAEGQLHAQEIFSQISLEGLNDIDEHRLELYEGFARWTAAEPSSCTAGE